MDVAPGAPLLDGLRGGAVIRQAPTLLKRLSADLATTMLALHRLDPTPVTAAVREASPEVAWTVPATLQHLSDAAIRPRARRRGDGARPACRHRTDTDDDRLVPRRPAPLQPPRRRQPGDGARLDRSRHGGPQLRHRVHRAPARDPADPPPAPVVDRPRPHRPRPRQTVRHRLRPCEPRPLLARTALVPGAAQRPHRPRATRSASNPARTATATPSRCWPVSGPHASSGQPASTSSS